MYLKIYIQILKQKMWFSHLYFMQLLSADAIIFLKKIDLKSLIILEEAFKIQV